jgi:hypothetical protein
VSSFEAQSCCCFSPYCFFPCWYDSVKVGSYGNLLEVTDVTMIVICRQQLNNTVQRKGHAIFYIKLFEMCDRYVTLLTNCVCSLIIAGEQVDNFVLLKGEA